MMWKMLPLVLVLVQCSPARVTPASFENTTQTYMRYVPGAGGGKGVMFNISLSAMPESLQVEKVVVNGVELEFNVNDTLITATKFYMDPDRTVEDPNPEPVDAVLYKQESFVAEIHYMYKEKRGTVKITNFEEEEQPLYP